MKRNKWQRRLLSCFLAVAVLLACFLGCFPVRAGAIVPLGLVQSALASFVTSAGYKMWSDNNGGEVMVEALSSLYQSWLDSTDPVGALTLGQMSENDYVYLDSSGQIVVRKAAADMFQQFADWIQTEYSVPIGSDTPTDVVAGETSWTDGNGVVAGKYVVDTPIVGQSNWYRTSEVIGVDYNNHDLYLCTVGTGSLYVTQYFESGGSQVSVYALNASTYQRTLVIWLEENGRIGGYTQSNYTETSQWISYNFFTSDHTFYFPTSTVIPTSTVLDQASVVGLGVTLAQAVADVVGQATDDDAVVIGVGAGVGATAQDIADLVAQGVKAQTLNPSVSITAEAVIDTPVQPYPDIDGLGLPSLGAALVSRFPFCVPWDFVDTLKILNATPTPPVFDVTFVPASVAARWGVSGNYTLHVDLTSPEYAKLFVALRWGTLVGFCLGLALLTKRLIWTA